MMIIFIIPEDEEEFCPALHLCYLRCMYCTRLLEHLWFITFLVMLLRGPVWATAAPEYWFHMSQGCYAIFSLKQHDKLLWGSLYIASAFGLRNKNASNFYFSLLFGPINICQCSGDVWSRANRGMRHARRISWAEASRGPYCHHTCSMHHIWCQEITFKSCSPFNHGYFMT